MFDDLINRITGDTGVQDIAQDVQSAVPDLPELPEAPEAFTNLSDAAQDSPFVGQSDDEQ